MGAQEKSPVASNSMQVSSFTISLTCSPFFPLLGVAAVTLALNTIAVLYLVYQGPRL